MFFPRFTFVLSCFFHFYAFSFPFGFSYIALLTVCNFLWYIMIYFWNRYELPALYSGQINALNLRVGLPSPITELRSSLAAFSINSRGMGIDGIIGEDSGETTDGQQRRVRLGSEDEAAGTASALADIHSAARKTVSKIQADPSNPLSSGTSGGGPTMRKKTKTKNVRYATEAEGSSAAETSFLTSFPPLPVRKTVTDAMRSARRSDGTSGGARASADSSDGFDLGLSIDVAASAGAGDQESEFNRKRVSHAMRQILAAEQAQQQADELSRGGSVLASGASTPYEDQINLSRRLQAQEMEERMNNLFLFGPLRASRVASRQRLDISSSSSPRVALDRAPSSDDLGHKKGDYSVFGNNLS